MALSLRFKKTPAPSPEPALPPLETDPKQGLSAEQAAERARLGLDNAPGERPGKTVKQIILGNVFTYFNLIFFILAALLIAVRSWLNLSFMGVVIANTAIGIIQELRGKHVLDALTLLNAQRCAVVREGREFELDASSLVRDDVVRFRGGDQVCADALVLDGECRVNEGLVTGEADEIRKVPGDALLSGSFLVAGDCRARLTAVGAASYASRLTAEAKGGGRRKQSEMMRSLSSLVKWIGILILPLGVLLCWKEVFWLGRGFAESVVSTVAALVGMIPEGLYLLTTMALAASVLRLAKKKTLVHELKSIEMLARVDTLCVDKTGTVTENRMAVEELIPLDPERRDLAAVEALFSAYAHASSDENDTMSALRERFPAPDRAVRARSSLPFTSAKKYGGVCFGPGESYLLGAPEVLLGEGEAKILEQAEALAARGFRVLLLARAGAEPGEGPLVETPEPVALAALRNPIRPEAPETFRYFARQGVAVKVISGDNPRTASEAAKQAGIGGAERYVDARSLDTEEKLAQAVGKYTVFGRVTPEQKRQLILALKKAGHTVAMTGDGVNDVLALKEADCSVAMASGSDAASRVSDIVLLDNNFSVMPSVVGEGRRVINNIQRSATLFLVKNIFSFALALLSLALTIPYPFTAAQISLVSMLTIGFPAFVLAMEPNESLIQGHFLRNVLYRAVPPALTDFVLVCGIMLFFNVFEMGTGMMGTVCAITMGIVGILVIIRISRPFTLLRRALVAVICAGFAAGVLLVPELFTLSELDRRGWLLLALFALLAWPVLDSAYRGWKRLTAALLRLARKFHK